MVPPLEMEDGGVEVVEEVVEVVAREVEEAVVEEGVGVVLRVAGLDEEWCGRLPTGGSGVLKGAGLALAAGLSAAGLVTLRLLPLPESGCGFLELLGVVPFLFWGVFL